MTVRRGAALSAAVTVHEAYSDVVVGSDLLHNGLFEKQYQTFDTAVKSGTIYKHWFRVSPYIDR